MATNEYITNADSLNYPVDADVVSGDFVVLGSLRGVAEVVATEGDDGVFYCTLRHVGVFIGTTADAVTVGAPLYLAGGETFGQALTTTATDNELVGHAYRAKGAGAGNVYVRINN